jgi:zinc/manganese transport system permease protein
VTALFLILVAVTVAESVQAVGALLVFGLMVTPAAIAQNWTARPYRGMAVSAGVALAVVWVGLTLAFYLPYPASFFITAVAFGLFLLSYATWRRPARIASRRRLPTVPSNTAR